MRVSVLVCALTAVVLVAPSLACNSDQLKDWKGGLSNWYKQLSPAAAKDNKDLKEAARVRCMACLHRGPKGRKLNAKSKCAFYPGTGECKAQGVKKALKKALMPGKAPTGAWLTASDKTSVETLYLACSRSLYREFPLWGISGIVKAQKANMVILKKGGKPAEELKGTLAVEAVNKCGRLAQSVLNSYKPGDQTEGHTITDIASRGVDLAQILGVKGPNTAAVTGVGAVLEAGVDMFVKYKLDAALIGAAKKGYCQCLLNTKATHVYSNSEEAHLETGDKVDDAPALDAYSVDLSALTYKKASPKVQKWCKEAGAELK